MAKSGSSNLCDGLIFVALVSISMGLMNCIPVYPLDGGRVVEALLRKLGVREKYRLGYQSVGVAAFYVLIAATFTSDLLKFIQ